MSRCLRNSPNRKPTNAQLPPTLELPAALQIIAFSLCLWHTARHMAPETKRLGSGIMKAGPDNPLDPRAGKIQIMYSVNEHAQGLLRTFGIAQEMSDERNARETLQQGGIGVTARGDVWQVDQSGEPHQLVSNFDLLQTLKAIQQNDPSLPIHEYEDTQSGKRILARTIEDHGKTAYQVWVPNNSENSEDMQYLIDAIGCLSLDIPAADRQGNPLTQDQIFHEALTVAVTFNMSSEGKPLVQQIPE